MKQTTKQLHKRVNLVVRDMVPAWQAEVAKDFREARTEQDERAICHKWIEYGLWGCE